MYQLTTIKADGTVVVGEPTAKDPSLETLQTCVGGYLQIVPYFKKHNGKQCVAYCNEEGKPQCLPVNIAATNAWAKEVKENTGVGAIHDVLVGDIVIVTYDTDAEREAM
jgi:hypothetical protein